MDIVAGLICDNAEIFGLNGVNHTIMDGRCVPFQESPKGLLQAIGNTIDTVDNRCLDLMGITDPYERCNQWATCNLSSFDGIPDYINGQSTVAREFVKCSKRDQCCHQGKLCRTLQQISGLTPRQIEYVTYTAQGLLNKEIALKMGVDIETVNSHAQNIRIKTGLARKADLVRFAQKLNLI